MQHPCERLVWDPLTNRFRNAVIIGPADTPFEDGTFRLVMHFEEQYPNKPPGVKFISQMFHPNVYGTGELCLDILQNRWSPTYDVAAILTSIQRYVCHPMETCTRAGRTITRCGWAHHDIFLAYSTIRIHLLQPTLRLQIYTKTIDENIPSECEKRLRRVGTIKRPFFGHQIAKEKISAGKDFSFLLVFTV